MVTPDSDVTSAGSATPAEGCAPNIMTPLTYDVTSTAPIANRTNAARATSFATSSAKLIEVKPLRNPMQHDLVAEPIDHRDGWFYPPTKPGLGLEVIEEVVDRYRSENVLPDPGCAGATGRRAS